MSSSARCFRNDCGPSKVSPRFVVRCSIGAILRSYRAGGSVTSIMRISPLCECCWKGMRYTRVFQLATKGTPRCVLPIDHRTHLRCELNLFLSLFIVRSVAFSAVVVAPSAAASEDTLAGPGLLAPRWDGLSLAGPVVPADALSVVCPSQVKPDKESAALLRSASSSAQSSALSTRSDLGLARFTTSRQSASTISPSTVSTSRSTCPIPSIDGARSS